MILTDRARYYRAKIEEMAQLLPEEKAFTMMSFFPLWTEDLIDRMGGVVPRETKVRDEGYLWVNMHDITTPSKNTKPSTDPNMWSRMVDPAQQRPAWFMPSWPFTQWGYGVETEHLGRFWVSLHPYNVWEPGSHGAPWREIFD